MREFVEVAAYGIPGCERAVPAAVREFYEHTAECMTCRKKIAGEAHSILDGQIHHKRCAPRSRETRSVAPVAKPAIIGTVIGAALTLGQPCHVRTTEDEHWHDEFFCLDSLAWSIEHDRPELRINHTRSVPGAYSILRVENFELEFAYSIHDTPAGRDLIAALRDGRARGCSVGTYEQQTRYGGPLGTREDIAFARLREISIVLEDHENRRPAWFGTWCRLV